MELEGEPARLIDAWEDADSPWSWTRSPRRPRGDRDAIRRRCDSLPPSVSAASTHALGLGDAIELARALGRLPERLIVFGIEAAGFEAGADLSPAVAGAIEPVAEAVLREWERADATSKA